MAGFGLRSAGRQQEEAEAPSWHAQVSSADLCCTLRVPSTQVQSAGTEFETHESYPLTERTDRFTGGLEEDGPIAAPSR